MERTFVASIGAGIDPERLRGAVERRSGAAAALATEDHVTIAFTGTAPAGRCLLDGTVDDLGVIARAAGLDAAMAPEPLLAAAYERLGTQLLTHLRGSFVLLLWDASGDVLVVRDQLGLRGGVWTLSAGGVLVAGEPADLLAALAASPGPDETALAHWLGVSGMPRDRTLFAGIKRVRAGHAIRISDGRVTAQRWWLPRPDVERGLDAQTAAARLQEALTGAVARSLPAAGPGAAGVLLSGGLDSSSVAAFASAAGVQRSYSAVFPDFETADETSLIDATTAALGLSSTRATVAGGGIADAALEYVERWLDPPVSPNLSFWLPLLRRAADDGVEVILDGQGGDEVFAASPFLLADRLVRGNVRGAIDLVNHLPGANGKAPRRVVLRWLNRYGLRAALPPQLAVARRALRRTPPATAAHLAPRMARAAVSEEPPEAWKQLGWPRWWAHLMSATADGIGPALAYDQIRRRDAMCGVRSRHPLADPGVVDCLVRIPPELAYHPRHSRPLLRDAVAGRIPDEVRLRRGKSHFDGPFHGALAGPDAGIVQALLGTAESRTRGLVQADVVARDLLAGPPSEPRERIGWGVYLWRLLTAEMWLRAVEDPAAVAQMRDLVSQSAAIRLTTSG
jgi:asparagine synthase (glutamine-hydrolysing)